MINLGLNAYHGDASVALVKDGELTSAIEKERLGRKKYCAGFAALAARAGPEQAGVRPEQRAKIPAISHVDGTVRLRTVSARTTPRYHAPIGEFERQTGVGLVLNSSFNEHEPVVATPADAIACYAKTRVSVLALENWVLTRR